VDWRGLDWDGLEWNGLGWFWVGLVFKPFDFLGEAGVRPR